MAFGIERKIDIVALLGFLMALVGGLYQIWDMYKGPVVKLLPIEQISLYKIQDGKAELFRIGARFSYINSGAMGYNEVITKERVEFKFNGRPYKMDWADFGEMDYENGKIIIKEKKDAQAIVVDAGNVKSHETQFASRAIRKPGENPYKNYLKWNDFLSGLSNTSQLKFMFFYETLNGDERECDCKISLSSNDVSWLTDKGYQVFSCSD